MPKAPTILLKCTDISLDAKILMNLLLILPFYLVSEVLLMLALGPAPLEMLRMLLVPGAYIHPALAVICTLILGLTVLLYRHSCTVKL